MLRGVCLTLLLITAPTQAHFNMLLPDKASVKKGEEVSFNYQWGHPFEHQLFSAPKPSALLLIAPDGKRLDLLERLTRFDLQSNGAKVDAYRLRFTPAERGDFVFVLNTPKIWLEEESEFVQDTVKVVLHVQAQKNWDASAEGDLEWLPLTRPYGLRPGMFWQAQLQGKLPDRPVEIERYNSEPPNELPADEFITRTVRPDKQGVVGATLDEPGWWSVTATRIAGTEPRDGKERKLLRRTTIWVFVNEKTSK